MLVRFSVSNFLSFYNKRSFSMLPGKVRLHQNHIYQTEDIKLKKGALLYGANASGKSNFIKSIQFAKECIARGIKNISTFSKHYRLNPNSFNELSEFEFEILIDSKVYAYGFTLNLSTKKIYEEWFVEVGKNDDIEIFTRKENENFSNELILNELSEMDKQKLNVYISDLEENQLLLEVLGQKKWENSNYSFLKILNWIKNNLIIVFPETDEFITEYYHSIEDLKKYLKAFDTGITDIEISQPKDFKELSIPDEIKTDIYNEISNVLSKALSFKEKHDKQYGLLKINQSIVRISLENNELITEELIFKHSEKKEPFKFAEESDGTKRILELIPLLEKAKCSSNTIIIDELERSLHPTLVNSFIENFYRNMENQRSQFIIATHESRLLDLDNLRQDEIWISERNSKEGTKLYSLDKYKVRFDAKIDKGYLLGRYGGIPKIRGLKEDISCENNG